jgi:predicted GNAT family acetyltransferase
MSDLRNDTDRQRYEREEEGLTSWADYRLQGARLYIDHVESPPPLRGTGASGRLMAAVADDARARGLKITPICGYAAHWLRRNAADLVG